MSTPVSAYTVGEGPRPVVLLHGFLGSGKNLRSLASRWSERAPDRRFFVPDLLGHGSAPPLPGGASLETLARAVLDAAGNAGLPSPFPIVGHSLGGRVALVASRLAPSLTERLVLLDITPGPIAHGTSASRRVLDVLVRAPGHAPDRRALKASLVDAGLSPPTADWLLMSTESAPEGGVRWRFDRAALDALHERVNGEDLWPDVEARRLPIRCVRGGRSPYVSDADVARLRAAGCPVDTLPNAGHDVHVEALDALVEILARTLP